MTQHVNRFSLTLLASLVSLGAFACGNSDSKDKNKKKDDGPPPALTVQDQRIANASKVKVPKATSPQGGFLVIHEKKDGKDTFGAVIGHAKLDKGENTDVRVELDRDAEQGEKLFAMLHEDTGTKGKYEFGSKKGADPPVKKDGEIVVKSFLVLHTPVVEVSDKTVSDSKKVTVDKAVSPRGGWIVIHEKKDGKDAPGAVIGHASLDRGVNENVEVSLNRDLQNNEKLFAMLHADTSEKGTYEFGDKEGADPPVKKNDEVVVTPFTVTLST